MGLVETWLSGIGLSHAIPSFQNAGIDSPAALAELDLEHYEALGVTEASQRRKLFYLVQRIKVAVNKGEHEGAEDQQEVDAMLAKTLNASFVEDENPLDLSVSQPIGALPLKNQGESKENKIQSKRSSPPSPSKADKLASSGLRSALTQASRSSRRRIFDDAADSPEENDLDDTDWDGEESSVVADDEASSARPINRRTSRRLQLKRRQNESDSYSTAESGQEDTTNGDLATPSGWKSTPAIRRAGAATIGAHLNSQKRQGSNRSVRFGRSKSVSDIDADDEASVVSTPTVKATNLRAPRSRRFESKLQNPTSRTGKALSAIPSESVAPMSPLVDLPVSRLEADLTGQSRTEQKKKTNLVKPRRSAASVARKAFQSSSDTESDTATNRGRSNSFSGSDSESQGTVRRSGSNRSRGDRFAPDATPATTPGRPSMAGRVRVAQTHSQSESFDSDDTPKTNQNVSQRKSAAVFIHGAPEDNSWGTQVEKLREKNQSEHDLFHGDALEHLEDEEMRIRVVVRKRPASRAESGDVDIIHPLDCLEYGKLLVYQPKTRVDLTREVETISFAFDNVFGEHCSNRDIYERAARHLIPLVFEGKFVNAFAYGQTGSGKTFTLIGSNITGVNAGTSTYDEANLGLYYMAAQDLFGLAENSENRHLSIGASLFEIYSGKLFDLMNRRTQIKCLEDSNGKVCFPGLTEHPVSSPRRLMKIIEAGARNRSTGTTSKNADSSRSHAVLQLSLRKTSRNGKKVEHGRLTFIDLAGSERGSDTATASRATRLEGAEINTSLLALKEVIRALATGDSMAHIPFRGSKLTQVLKESFVGKHSKTVMIACIAPNMTNCEHTLNTLRYADRVKERNPENGALSASVLSSRLPASSKKVPRAIMDRKDLRVRKQDPEEDDEEEYDDYFDTKHESMKESDGDGDGDGDSDLLDALLAEPSFSQESVQMSEGESQSRVTLAGNSIKSAAAESLIVAHKNAMGEMLEMIKTEMKLVNRADMDRDTVDDYLVQLETMHENQITLMSKLHEKLLDYQNDRDSKCGDEKSLNQTASLDLLSDDDSFYDLRD